MARSRSTPEPPGGETILDVDVTDEMQGSFLEYAYSVIYSRALPDARDGLKPVQRRILFQMAQMGLRPDRGHVKSARVVGEVMGRLHPHGDGAIYDALVRMAQPFSLRLPTVDGHGNFGSADDGPAAMRYCLTGDTRVRLADGTSRRIDRLVDLPGPGERDLVDVDVVDHDGKPVRASVGFHSGEHPVFRVTTVTGHSIRGSANHPLLCLVNPTGVPMPAWLRIDEITPGTVVCLAGDVPLFRENVGRRSPLSDNSSVRRQERVPFVRDYLTSEWARRQCEVEPWLLDSIDRPEIWSTQQAELRLAMDDPEVARVIMNVMERGYRYVEVAAVTPDGRHPVYSLRVDSAAHSFLAGGFVNHNTECRLAPPALDMTGSLDEDTVDFEANYDGRELEPSVLPAALPHLLVNGASGIAVGMATNMAPHNLGEVVAGARHLLKHPNASLDTLIRHIPGPDLPTGGLIVGLDGIRQAYETGKGSFRMRATTRIEQVTPRRQGIVVTSLPYGVGPERVIEKIKELVIAKKLTGIANLIDLTDEAHGLRLIIEIKSGFNPQAVLAQLYRQTPLEEQFSINNVALVEGRPQTLGLKQLLRVYLDHRLEVVRRRSEYRRTRATERLHLVDGLLIAIVDIDEVIAIIRGSDDTAMARHRLMAAFDLTETQTNYILEMPLRRLTKFSRIELEAEADELRRTIEALSRILEEEGALEKVVSDELAEVAQRLGDPRRTILLESDGADAVTTAEVPLEVPDAPCWVLLSNTGLLARTATDERPGSDGPRAKHDCVVAAVRATTRGQVGLVCSDGLLRKVSVLDLPALVETTNAPALSGGTPVGALTDVPRRTSVVGLAGLGDTIALATATGVVKRLVVEDVPTRPEFDVIKLAEGDRVVGCAAAGDDTRHLVLISSDGQLLRFPAKAVRPQGRGAAGMAGMKLTDGHELVFFGVVDPRVDGCVVTVAGSSDALPGTTAGTGKVTPLSAYPAKGRATGGVRCHRFRSGEDRLQLAWAGPTPARASSAAGVAVDLPEPDPRRDGTGRPLANRIAAVSGPIG